LPGLSDPALQPLFEEIVPNALDPSFKYNTSSGIIIVVAGDALHQTGWVDSKGRKLSTPIWGYGTNSERFSWPGRTFEVNQGEELTVRWENDIRNPYLLTGVGNFYGQSVIDPTIHWAYGLHGCGTMSGTSPQHCGDMASLDTYGVPIVPHLHGGHTASGSDGLPEAFFSRGFSLRGPQWSQEDYLYSNDQRAGSLWYHDHAIGVTRLNVYAGLAGFYFIRDEFDTGKDDNPLNLPAYPYEAAFVIQDRMFKENEELFFPAFEGDPAYADYIDADIQSRLPNQHGPSILTEFFGDHMVVNGKIWPKMEVEPRKYRLRLLNGCDSRFVLLQFVVVDISSNEIQNNPVTLPFTVIGSDQGLADMVDWVEIGTGASSFLVFEPGARFDIIVDFTGIFNQRVIMRNLGADSPFNGLIDGAFFQNRRTDRIMAFDVVNPLATSKNIVASIQSLSTYNVGTQDVVEVAFQAYAASSLAATNEPRRVALFEGNDKYGRLEPVLGTVDASSMQWPTDQVYVDAGLVGGMIGSVPTADNTVCNAIETWEIWNPTADAHPIHLHLVHFKILERYNITWDSNANAGGLIDPQMTANGDGTFLVQQNMVEHDSQPGDPSSLGAGFRLMNPTRGTVPVTERAGHHFVGGRRDMVVALPGQVTTIMAKFDKSGRYVWHCHILSHEDHNMMHVVDVTGDCV
jgi:spore coat protein A, manganese oxidase